MAASAAAEPPARLLSFDELDGWAADDHDAALSVFVKTCDILKDPDWAPICEVARNQSGGRAFFELFFRPVQVGDEPALFTGYFEPELSGSLTRTARYRYPLYSRPKDMPKGQPFATRAEIEAGLLAGRGLEIVWVDDPVERFFLQIQGSGRVRLPDGQVVRVGYGGNNGHPYRSVGKEMVRRGIYAAHQVSAQVIKNWVRRNPVEGLKLLHHNPSFVFFRKVTAVPADKGPIGAMNRSVTPERTIAVDPAFTPLGAPVWIEKGGSDPIRRLTIAQDTGSAIKGPQRADIFYGTGDAAGRAAGKIKDPGRMVVLLPIQRAFALATEE
ncbi:murein transglycosylase A [Aliiruegeria haliotis]|nr:murein transglycosylase A [Aliiruegeria haliotis]